MRKRLCIISYSPIKSDARVLRQIEYLAPHYDLTVIGFGEPPEIPTVDWKLFPYRDTTLSKAIRNGLQIIGRALPIAYDVLELARERYWITRRAVDVRPDAVLADDLSALPVAAHIARRTGAKLVFDAHEFSPLEQDSPKFKRLETPNRSYLIHKYARQLDASLTVCEPIAERYAREYGFRPQVLMSAPKFVSVPEHSVSAERVRLIYHGIYQRERGIEDTIRAVALADARYELHLMLIIQPTHLAELRTLSEQVAPGRVIFHEPVVPGEIVSRISEYDIGIYVQPPTTYNFSVVLPNKFFEFIMAGLAVVIGPTETMARIVDAYGFGYVAPSFDPAAVAAALNALTVDQLITMRWRARKTAQVINADTEMAKLIALFKQVLGE